MIRPAHVILFAAAMVWTCASADVCGLPNESYNICGELCAPTCANPHPNVRLCPGIVCVHNFTSGCRCEKGYVRDTESSGSCLRLKDCPKQA